MCHKFQFCNKSRFNSFRRKKVNYEIRKSKRNFPNKKIIVTGCAAQINPKKYINLNDVDYVIGNKEKLEQRKQIEFSEKIDELNQETDTLLEEIDKWQM